MSGTSQTFRILDIGLDGKRLSFADQPKGLAPNLVLYADELDTIGE